VRYLKHLIEAETPVRLKLTDGEEVSGAIEYYDQSFIRLTRVGASQSFHLSSTTSNTWWKAS
jgi:sRNA-binding regulator protein Hfq